MGDELVADDDVFDAEAAAAATFSSILGLLRLTSRELDGLDELAVFAFAGLDSACLVGEPLLVVVSALEAVRVFRRAGAAAGLRGDRDVAGDLSLPFVSVSFLVYTRGARLEALVRRPRGEADLPTVLDFDLLRAVRLERVAFSLAGSLLSTID